MAETYGCPIEILTYSSTVPKANDLDH